MNVGRASNWQEFRAALRGLCRRQRQHRFDLRRLLPAGRQRPALVADARHRRIRRDGHHPVRRHPAGLQPAWKRHLVGQPAAGDERLSVLHRHRVEFLRPWLSGERDPPRPQPAGQAQCERHAVPTDGHPRLPRRRDGAGTSSLALSREAQRDRSHCRRLPKELGLPDGDELSRGDDLVALLGLVPDRDLSTMSLDMAEVWDALTQDLETWTLSDPNNRAFSAPGVGPRSASDAERKSFHKLISDMAKMYGPDPHTWTYSRAHQRVLENLADISGLNYGPRPERGDGNTPLAAGGYPSTHGPSWRMVVDWGSQTFQGIYPGGQSENPASAWYTDRVDTWFAGQLNPMLTAEQAAAAGGIRTWDMRP